MGGPLVDSKTEIEILRRQVANLENGLRTLMIVGDRLSEEKLTVRRAGVPLCPCMFMKSSTRRYLCQEEMEQVQQERVL